MAGLFFEDLDAVNSGDRTRALTEREAKQLDDAWKILLAECHEFAHGRHPMDNEPRKFKSSTYTKGSLAVEFMHARLYGDPIRRCSTLPYNPHRLEVASGGNRPYSGLFQAALDSDVLRRSFIKMASYNSFKPTFDNFLTGLASFPIHGRKLVQDFPADAAAALFDEFCPAGGAVLDPCHGWGGRMLGFLLSKTAQSYIGFDPCRETHLGVGDIFRDLSDLTEFDKTATLYCNRFECQQQFIKQDYFDFAFTSPPYFDIEKYIGDGQSHAVFPTFTEWLHGFYQPMIFKVAGLLKPGAHFVLNVASNKYPLAAEAVKYVKASKHLAYIETRGTSMRAQVKNEDDGEVLIIFQKRGS